MKLNKTLKLKMTGDDVAFVQKRLKDLGFFKENINGIFSQNMLVSVTNFQRSVGVKDTGDIDYLTYRKLMNYGKDLQIIEEKPAPKRTDISYITTNGLEIYDNLIPEDQYYKEKNSKTTLYLHSTSGGSRPDLAIGHWGKDFKKNIANELVLDSNKEPMLIKTAHSYIIGRSSSSTDDNEWDGKIIRTFDDSYWAYHLGLNDKIYENLNKNSIAISICNYGQLSLKNGVFYNLVNKPINEKDVVKLNKPFKGYEYYEKYTDYQIENLRKLLIYLINKHNIRIEGKIYNEKWFDYNKKWLNPGGIRSISQVRLDKIGIFPQKEMIQMLNSI